MNKESILRLGESYQLVCEQGLPSTQGTTDKDRKPGFYNVPNKGRRYWTGDKWTYQNPLGGIGLGGRGVADVLSRNAQRAAETGANVIGGIYDKSKEVGDNIVRGGAEVIDGFTGGSGAREFVKDRQDAAKERQDAYGGKTPSQLAADALKDPGRAVQNVTSAPDAIRPLKPGESGGSGGGAGDGGDEGSSGQTEPQVRPVQPTNNDGSDVTQKGPSSAGLTPMQQWAKNFPKLAAKVKPGQVGYDDIQKMKSPEPKEVSASSPNLSQKVSQVKNNTSTSFSKPTNLRPTNSPTIKTPKLNMNKSQNNTKKAFSDIPEDYFQHYMVNQGLAESVESANIIIEHMTPEYKLFMDENAKEWARKAGDWINNSARSIGRGAQGKKVKATANPTHRALNSVTRGVRDVVSGFSKGVTSSSDVASKNETPPKKDPPKQETKNDSTPTPKAVSQSTPTNSSTPSSSTPSNSGNKGKSGGRLDKALNWASDPKNKDAWMGKTRKEEYNSIEDAYNSMYNGESLDEMDAAAWDKALEKAAAATQKRHKEQGYKVPGTNAMDDVIKRVMAKKKGKV